MSTEGWMDKENMRHIYNRILFNPGKKGNPAICDMDGSKGHYANWSNRHSKTKTVWSHSYVQPKTGQTHRSKE